MSWFQKFRPSRIRTEGGNKRNVPEGLWTKCSVCTAVLYRPELERNLQVCPKCSHHMRVSARSRLEQFLDPGEHREIATGLESVDTLRFKDSKKYKDRLNAAQKKTGESDALIAMAGQGLSSFKPGIASKLLGLCSCTPLIAVNEGTTPFQLSSVTSSLPAITLSAMYHLP